MLTFFNLSDGNMEATLLHFVLDITQLLLTNIPQDLAQHPLEGVVLYGTTFGPSGWGNGGEAVIADIESGAEKVATLAGGIAVTALQTGDIVFCPKYT